MARRGLVFDHPDHVVAGTVGEPGRRAFYLQARQGRALVSIGLEKAQVAAVAAGLDDLLNAAEVEGGGSDPSTGLEEPVVALFQAQSLALGWDASSRTVVIEVHRGDPEDSDDEDESETEPFDIEGPQLVRVRLQPAEARGFARAAAALVAAGRPACPFCGQPLDPQGHFCARSNGQLS